VMRYDRGEWLYDTLWQEERDVEEGYVVSTPQTRLLLSRLTRCLGHSEKLSDPKFGINWLAEYWLHITSTSQLCLHYTTFWMDVCSVRCVMWFCPSTMSDIPQFMGWQKSHGCQLKQGWASCGLFSLQLPHIYDSRPPPVSMQVEALHVRDSVSLSVCI
jgi:hypothetical protein